MNETKQIIDEIVMEARERAAEIYDRAKEAANPNIYRYFVVNLEKGEVGEVFTNIDSEIYSEHIIIGLQGKPRGSRKEFVNQIAAELKEDIYHSDWYIMK